MKQTSLIDLQRLSVLLNLVFVLVSSCTLISFSSWNSLGNWNEFFFNSFFYSKFMNPIATMIQTPEKDLLNSKNKEIKFPVMRELLKIKAKLLTKKLVYIRVCVYNMYMRYICTHPAEGKLLKSSI